MQRGTSRRAGHLMRNIIANHDDPVLTAHEFATHSPNSHLPDRVRHLVERRTATVKRHRAHHQYWQAQTLRLAQSMEQPTSGTSVKATLPITALSSKAHQ
jgi:hypothetical protein